MFGLLLLPSSTAYPTTQLPLIRLRSLRHGIAHGSPSWGHCSGPVTSHSPVRLVTTASPVLSSHFPDRGTEVLRTGQVPEVTGKAGGGIRIQAQVSLVPKRLTSKRHICWRKWAQQIRDKDLGRRVYLRGDPRSTSKEKGSETRKGNEQVTSVGSAPRELWEKEQNGLQGRGSHISAPLPTSLLARVSRLGLILLQPEEALRQWPQV